MPRLPEIRLRFENLQEGRLGYFDNKTHILVMNTLHLNDSCMQEMEALCHEVYHAYQYDLMMLYRRLKPAERQLYLFQPIGEWENEIGDYADGLSEEDFSDYYAQQYERAARDYAKETAVMYSLLIKDMAESR